MTYIAKAGASVPGQNSGPASDSVELGTEGTLPSAEVFFQTSKLIDAFFRSGVERHKFNSETTVLCYKSDLMQWIGFLADRIPSPAVSETSRPGLLIDDHRILQASVADAQGFIDSLRERSCTPATLARRKASVSSLYQYLKSEGLVAQNIGRAIADVRDGPSRVNVATEDTVNALIGFIDDSYIGIRLKAFIHCIFGIGVKPSELVTLKGADLILGENDWNGSSYLSAPGPSAEYKRNLPLESRTSIALREYMIVRAAVLEANGVPLARHAEYPLFLNKGMDFIDERSMRRFLENIVPAMGDAVPQDLTFNEIRLAALIQIMKRLGTGAEVIKLYDIPSALVSSFSRSSRS